MTTYFRKISRKCKFLDRRFASDWVTCTHKDHPNAIKTCSAGWCPIYKGGELNMKPTQERIEKLAAEVTDNMDLDALCDAVRDQLETYYQMLSEEEFTKAWIEVFGELPKGVGK